MYLEWQNKTVPQ